MDCDGKDEVIIFPIEVIEMISPYVFDVAGVYESMAVWRILDEHPAPHMWLSILFYGQMTGGEDSASSRLTLAASHQCTSWRESQQDQY